MLKSSKEYALKALKTDENNENANEIYVATLSALGENEKALSHMNATANKFNVGSVSTVLVLYCSTYDLYIEKRKAIASCEQYISSGGKKLINIVEEILNRLHDETGNN